MRIKEFDFKTFAKSVLLTAGAIILFSSSSDAQDTSLSRHPFMYVGEWDTRKPDTQSIFMVKDGKVKWRYTLPLHNNGKIQEFDDVTLLPDGNVVFAAMSKVGIVSTKTNDIIWEFKCPEGTESHSCQPIGKDSVLIALNGVPGKLLIYDTRQNKLLKEIPVPTAGTVVWEITQKDVSFKLYNNQSALRLANGNTVICNWVAGNSHSLYFFYRILCMVAGEYHKRSCKFVATTTYYLEL